MGTGIAAAIPLVFTQYSKYEPLKERYFAEGFVDNYNIEVENGKKYYCIKENLLIDNYKTFLLEFYDLIGEKSELTENMLIEAKNLIEFTDVYKGRNRNNRAPFIYTCSSSFGVLGCECEEYWLFYSGSSKAYLEVYATLLHFELILSKAMKNPLANATKFGIFG